MKTAVKPTKTNPVTENYYNERYVKVATLAYYVDCKGTKRHTVVMTYDKGPLIFKFATVDEARDCWRSARKAFTLNPKNPLFRA